MPISLNTGSAEVDKNPFPPPPATGIYFVKITKVTEKPIKDNEEVIRISLNVKVISDNSDEPAKGFAAWSALNIGDDQSTEVKEKLNIDINQRSIRNMLRVLGGVSDEELNAGKVEVDLSALEGMESWAFITVKDNFYNGEKTKQGNVGRFMSPEDRDRHNNVLTPDHKLVVEKEEEAPAEEAEEAEEEAAEEEVLEEEVEEEIPATPPPPKKAATAATTTAAKPAAATTAAKPSIKK